MNYVQQPVSLKYMQATDLFYEKRDTLIGMNDIIQFLHKYAVINNSSRLQVTSHSITLCNIILLNNSNLVESFEDSYNLVTQVMGGHTNIITTHGQSDKFCFAAVSKDIYEQFMSNMDIPMNKNIPVQNTEELEMILDYFKYLGTNIPAPAMREQLPDLLKVASQLLGFDDHTNESGTDLKALWDEYVKRVDEDAAQYETVIDDYLHRVPTGSVSDDQVCELYKLCAEKLQSMINEHAQCSFLFTASYSYGMACKMQKGSSAYAVYMWQACTALAQALLVATNIDIAHLAPADLFAEVNSYYRKQFTCEYKNTKGFEEAYKQLLDFGRQINWGM